MDAWPFKGQKPELAWGNPPNLQATAVPLSPQDLQKGSLDTEAYREALAARVAWLIQQSGSPEEAIRWLERRVGQEGIFLDLPADDPERAAMDLLTNPSFQELLAQAADLPPFPVPVRRMADAARVVRETSLEEWLAAVVVQPGSTE
jgi:hypothetical protein